MEDLFSHFEEMTIKEIEKKESLSDDDLHDSKISPWFIKSWEEFKSSIQDGDKIYYNTKNPNGTKSEPTS